MYTSIPGIAQMLERGKRSRRFCRKEGRQDKRELKLRQARTRQLPRQAPRQLLRQVPRQVLLESGTSMTRRRVSAGSAMLMSPALETTGVQAARRYLYTLSSHMKNEDLEMSPLVAGPLLLCGVRSRRLGPAQGVLCRHAGEDQEEDGGKEGCVGNCPIYPFLN